MTLTQEQLAELVMLGGGKADDAPRQERQAEKPVQGGDKYANDVEAIGKAIEAKDARIAELEDALKLFIKYDDTYLGDDYCAAIEAAEAALKDKPNPSPA